MNFSKNSHIRTIAILLILTIFINSSMAHADTVLTLPKLGKKIQDALTRPISLANSIVRSELGIPSVPSRSELRRLNDNQFLDQQLVKLRAKIQGGSSDYSANFKKISSRLSKDAQSMLKEDLIEVAESFRLISRKDAKDINAWESIKHEHPIGTLIALALFILESLERGSKIQIKTIKELESILNLYNKNKTKWRHPVGSLSVSWLFSLALSAFFSASKKFVRLSKQLVRLPGDYKYDAVALNLMIQGVHLSYEIVDVDHTDLSIVISFLKFAFKTIEKSPRSRQAQKLRMAIVRILVGLRSFYGISKIKSDSRGVPVRRKLRKKMSRQMHKIRKIIAENNPKKIIKWIEKAREMDLELKVPFSFLYFELGNKLVVSQIKNPIDSIFFDYTNPAYQDDLYSISQMLKSIEKEIHKDIQRLISGLNSSRKHEKVNEIYDDVIKVTKGLDRVIGEHKHREKRESRSELRSNRKISRRDFFAIAAGFGLTSLFGCAANQAIERARFVPPDESASTSRVVIPSTISLDQLRKLLIESNYQILIKQNQRLIEDAKASGVNATNFSLGVEFGLTGDGRPSFKIKGAAQIENLGQLGIDVTGIPGEEVHVLTSFAAQLVHILTGAWKVEYELAKKMAQIAVLDYLNTIDQKYEEASRLLIQLAFLQERMKILGQITDKAERTQKIALGRGREGLSKTSETFKLANMAAQWAEEQEEVQRAISQTTIELAALISRSSGSGESRLTAMVSADRIPLLSVSEMVNRATEIGSDLENVKAKNHAVQMAAANRHKRRLQRELLALQQLPKIEIGIARIDRSIDQSDANRQSKFDKLDRIAGNAINMIQNAKLPNQTLQNAATGAEQGLYAKRILDELSNESRPEGPRDNALLSIPDRNLAAISSKIGVSWQFGKKQEIEKTIAALNENSEQLTVQGVQNAVAAEIEQAVLVMEHADRLIGYLEGASQLLNSNLDSVSQSSSRFPGKKLITNDQSVDYEIGQLLIKQRILALRMTQRSAFEKLKTLGAIPAVRSELRLIVRFFKSFIIAGIIALSFLSFTQSAFAQTLPSAQPVSAFVESNPKLNVREIQSVEWLKSSEQVIGASVRLNGGQIIKYGGEKSGLDLIRFVKNLGLKNTGNLKMEEININGKSVKTVMQVSIETSSGNQFVGYTEALNFAKTFSGVSTQAVKPETKKPEVVPAPPRPAPPKVEAKQPETRPAPPKVEAKQQTPTVRSPATQSYYSYEGEAPRQVVSGDLFSDSFEATGMNHIRAPVSGQATWHVREGDVIQAGDLILTLANSKLDQNLGMVNRQFERSDQLFQDLVRSENTAESDIVGPEMHRSDKLTRLNLSKRHVEIVRSVTAPFPLRVTQRHGNNFDENDPLFEYVPLNQVRISISVPAHVTDYRYLKLWINDIPATRILVVREATDSKNKENTLILDALLARPLGEAESDLLRYKISFERPIKKSPSSSYADQLPGSALTVFARVGSRREEDLKSPIVDEDASGRMVFQFKEGVNLDGEAVIAKVEGEEFYRQEIERIETDLRNLQDFMSKTSGAVTGMLRSEYEDLINLLESSLAKLRSALTQLEARSLEGGVLVGVSALEGQAAVDGQTIGRLMTHEVIIPNILISDPDVTIKNGSVAIVQLPFGEELLGRIIGIKRNVRSDEADLSGAVRLTVKVLDRHYMAHPGMVVKVIIPGPDMQPHFKALTPQNDALPKTPALARFEAGTLPLSVEWALMNENPSSNSSSKAVKSSSAGQSVMEISDPVERVRAFEYLLKSRRDAEFYNMLSEIAFNGALDLTGEALRVLREEGRLKELVLLFDRLANESHPDRLALVYQELLQLIDENPFEQSSSSLMDLMQMQRQGGSLGGTAERALLLILAESEPNASYALRILRSITEGEDQNYLKDETLLTLLSQLSKEPNAEKNPRNIKLSNLIRKELLRRIMLTKLGDRQFGQIYTFLTNERGSQYPLMPKTHFVGAKDRLDFVEIDNNLDIEFLRYSPDWQEMAELVHGEVYREAVLDLTRLLVDRSSQREENQLQISLNDAGIAHPAKSETFFSRMSLEQRRIRIDYFAAGKHYHELIKLLESERLQNEEQSLIMNALVQNVEGRYFLLRTYRHSSDRNLDRAIEGVIFPRFGSLIDDVLNLKNLDLVTRPGLSDDYETALLKLYGSPFFLESKRDILRVSLASFFPSDFELRTLVNEDDPENSRRNRYIQYINRDVLSDFVKWEITRRSVPQALNRALARWGFQDEGKIPDLARTIFRMVRQSVDLTSPDYSKTPMELLETAAKHPRVSQAERDLLNTANAIMKYRISNLEKGEREKTPGEIIRNSALGAVAVYFKKVGFGFVSGVVAAFFTIFALWKILSFLVSRIFDRMKLVYLKYQSMNSESSHRTLNIIRNQIVEIRSTELSMVAQAFEEWLDMLDRPDVVSVNGFKNMHRRAIRIIRDRAVVITPQLIDYDLKGIKRLNKLYTILAELSELTVRRISSEADRLKQLPDNSMRESLRLDAMVFIGIARYALLVRKALAPIAVHELLEGYRIPKVRVHGHFILYRWYAKSLNLFARTLYFIVRVFFFVWSANRLVQWAFPKRLKQALDFGNHVIPSLYSHQNLNNILERFYHDQHSLHRAKTRPEDFFELEKAWVGRRFYVRLISMIVILSQANLVGMLVSFLMSIIYGNDWQFLKIYTNGLAVVTALFVPALSLFLHWRPIFKTLSERFVSQHQQMLDALQKRIDRLLGSQYPLDPQVASEDADGSAQQMIQLQVRQTLNAMDHELEQRSGRYVNLPSAHLVAIVYNHGQNLDKESYLRKVISKSVRSDIPVLMIAASEEIRGSGMAALEARHQIELQYQALRNQYPALPEKIADASIFIGLAGGSDTDVVPLASGSDAAIPLPFERDGQKLTTIDYALANFYRLTQAKAQSNQPQAVRAPKGLQVVSVTDSVYIGPELDFKRGFSGVTLFGTRMSFSDVDEQGLGVFFTNFSSGKEIQRFFEHVPKSRLKQLIAKYSDTMHQADLDNDVTPQLKAFTGITVMHFDDYDGFEKLNQYFKARYEDIMRILNDPKNRPQVDRPFPPIDFVNDILIPMILSSREISNGSPSYSDQVGEFSDQQNLRRWLEVRTAQYRSILHPDIDFYAKIFAFYESNKNPADVLSFAPNHYEAHFADLRKLSVYRRQIKNLQELLANGESRKNNNRNQILVNAPESAFSELPDQIVIAQIPVRTRQGTTNWITFFSGLEDDILKGTTFLNVPSDELSAELKEIIPDFQNHHRLGSFKLFPITENSEDGLEIAAAVTRFIRKELSAEEVRSLFNQRRFALASFEDLVVMSDDIDYAKLSSSALQQPAPVETRSELRVKSEIPTSSDLITDLSEQVRAVVAQNAQTRSELRKLFEGGSRYQKGNVGYAVSWNVAFEQALLPLVSEFARYSDNVVGIVAPSNEFIKLLEKENLKLHSSGKRLIHARTREELERLLREEHNVSFAIYLTSEEIEKAIVERENLFDEVRLLNETEINSLRNGSQDLLNVLQILRAGYHRIFSSV